ncbi:hypothetical protein CFC21_075117 [Triticum aestivum]|uniref:NAC domain-containing protein n=3 Tax=Triticum aestivum TaxID=4565 RepID=A0A9R1HRG1_WHEAT|nr:hypothetical protein CFC21_075117 [Triticum aestivum]
MLATGELQSLAPQLDFLELAKLLRLKVAGEPFPHSFIHELNAYSAAPADLVRGRDPAPGTGQAGDGKGMAWYFYSPVNWHDSAGGAPRRNRQVGGGGERRFWHPEGGEKPILGPDSKPVGAYWRTLSYVLKINNPPGAKKSFRNKRLGWCMVEIGLQQQQDGAAGQQWELCKVYRSPSPRSTADPVETSTAAAAGAQGILPAAGNGVSGAEGRPHDSALEGEAIPEVLGGDMPCPPAPPSALCDYNVHFPGVNRSPALLIAPASIHGTLAIMKKTDAASAAATVVMKLDGSSIPSAERMKEMANLVLGFESPVVVVSAMGNTASNILLAAWKALSCDLQEASEIDEFKNIRELHLRTVDELGLDSSTVSGSLDQLEQHLQYAAMTKEMTSMTRDCLVSVCEGTSTKMFFEYLNKLGKGAVQEWELHTVAAFGSDGNDLAAAIIGRDLGLEEIQVWKDQDIFTCDTNVCAKAIPVPYLTFDEAAELGFFSAQSIQLATECGISVRVKNSFNPEAPGTLITKTRDTTKSALSSIALKSNITILDIQRTGTLDQSAFVEKAISKFKYFEYLGISVDWVATSENMSFTLVPSKPLSQDLIQLALDNAVKELGKIATVHQRQDISAICLIGNPQMSLPILGKVLNVLGSNNFDIEKVPRGSPKVANVSLVVRDNAAERCVQLLHSVFFELNGCPVPVNSQAAASGSSDKRKADGDHPDAPTGVRREMAETESLVPEELERSLLSNDETLQLEFQKFLSDDRNYEPSGLLDNVWTHQDDEPPSYVWTHQDDELPSYVFQTHQDDEPPSYVFQTQGGPPPRRLRLLYGVPSSHRLQEVLNVPPRTPQEVGALIRIHRGVRSRMCLAISFFQNMDYLGISINWVATSEGKMPLTLVTSELLSQALIQPALEEAGKELQNTPAVHGLYNRSVISLTGNAQLSPSNLRKVLNVLGSSPVVVEKVSQGSSKVAKISLVVHGNVAQHYGEVLRSAFFKNPVDSSAPSSYGVKKNTEDPPSGGFSEAGISKISERVRRLAID